MFNVIHLVSGGPDGQTDILITEAYRAFKVLKRYGLAVAYALIIFAVLISGAMTDKITKPAKGVRMNKLTGRFLTHLTITVATPTP